MANPFKDMSVIMQALVAAAIAVVIVLIGVYLPFSPVAQERSSVDKAVEQRKVLNDEVTQLQVYKQRYGELKQQMDALSKQLETLKTIVPEEKEVDEFIRLVQGAAAASNVTIRRFTAQAVVPKEYHYDMPFELQADGPYFNDPDKSAGTKYPLRPGTTVSAIFTATTFFTKPADVSPAPAPGARTQPVAGKP